MTPCKNCRYKKALRGGVRACNNLLQPNPYILVFGGCGRLLHALTPPRSAFLYLQFCTVSSLHPTSFLMIFTLVVYWIRTGSTRSSCYRLREGGFHVTFSGDQTLMEPMVELRGNLLGQGRRLAIHFSLLTHVNRAQ